eukprot:gene7663-5510_t
MSESLANEEVNEHHGNTSSHRVQPTAGIAIPENEEVIDVRELFRSPMTLFRFFEPLYRRVAFPSSSPDADAAFVSLQNAIELHQRWEAACQSESRNPLRAVLTLAPEDRPYVHYVLGLMVLKDLGLSKGLPPTPESFHQGVHHLLEFSAQPFEYAPAFFQAAMALESSPMGDVPTAICLYARAVKAGGIPSACYRLATYYFDKKLREGYKSVVLQQVPDDEAALELLKTAAEKGHEGAQLEYVTRCLAKINLAPPILAMSFAPNAPPETVIAMLTSTPSTKDIEHIAKRMADDVEALTNCIVYLSVQLSPAAVMPRLVTLDELDTHRDSPYLLYQFAQCQEKLAAYTSIDSEDDPAAQALVREYTSTAILAYHRALLVQPNELHLPSALRLYNFFCQEGEGLEVDVDGSKRILPVFPDLGRNMERYDRDIARGGLGIDGGSISGSTADANNDTILVDWPLKRWTFLQRLMPRASMVGTIAGAGEVQFVVGNCYESGLVAAHGQILVTPDLFAAIRAWKKAVKYEYAPAMFKLVPYYTEGVEYTNAYEHYGGSGNGSGNGSGGGSGHESSIKKNVLLANQYLYRAAEYGIGDAQYAMGVKEEEEALRSASKQAQRITSFSATSMQNLLQALPTEATTEATTAEATAAAEDSNTTRPTSLSRTTSASSSSMVNMWALIHHPHFVLAKQWYLRGVQQSGHVHCKAALLRIVQLEQQAAVQQSHQRQSLSRLRSPPLTPSGGATTASTAPTSSSSSQSHLLPRTPSASLGDAPTPRTATAAASVVAASVASSSTHEVAHERERGVLVPLVSQPSFDDLPVVEETGEDDEAVGGGGPAVISPASSASASASGSRSFHMAAPGINLMADHHPASPNASSQQAMVPRVGSSDSAMAAVATAVPIQRASSSESIPSSTQQGAATATVATVVVSPMPAAPTPTGAIGHTVQHPSPHHQPHQSMAHHGSSPAMAQHMVYDPATAAAYPATPPHHHPHHQHLPPSPQPTMMYYAASPTSPPPPPHQPQLYPLHPGQMVAGYYYPPVDPHYAAMSQPHPAAYGGHHHSPSAYGGYAPAANASMMSMPPPSSPPPSATSATSTSTTTTTQQSSNDAHPVPYYVEHYRQHHSQPAPPHHH